MSTQTKSYEASLLSVGQAIERSSIVQWIKERSESANASGLIELSVHLDSLANQINRREHEVEE